MQELEPELLSHNISLHQAPIAAGTYLTLTVLVTTIDALQHFETG